MPFLRRTTRRLLATTLALAGLCALAPVARAAPPAELTCPPVLLEQPFLRFGDPNQYTLLPVGDFEDQATGWTLDRARVELGNEPFYVRSPRDKRSLRIAPGSSVVSTTTCAGVTEPTLRFFARSSGSTSLLDGGLRVDVLYADAFGRAQSLQIATVAPMPEWAPSAPIAVLANLLTVLPDAQAPIEFRFTALTGSTWHIDDVYLDPQKRG